jgi:hypothetical protein
VQKIQIRKVFQAAGVTCQPGTEIERAPELLRVLRELAAKAGGEAPKPEIPDQNPIDDLQALAGNALLAELFSQRNALIQSSADWQTTGQQIAKRWPVWTLLQDLLDHAKDLGPYKELQGEAAEIQKQRALLADHDPVQALLDKTVDLLRTSVNHHVETYRTTYDAELAALEQDSNWQSLTAEQCQAILAKHGLHETVSVDVSTPERILDELERCALSQWADRTQALKGRFEQARLEAAKLLEPKVQRVDLPRRTLTDEADLADWLKEAEQRIRDKLTDGPVMI